MLPSFDSRNPFYKSINRAVSAGTPLRLRLLLHCFDVWDVSLMLCDDKTGCYNPVFMTYEQDYDGGKLFSVEISLDTGLYWYRFSYCDCYGCHIIGRGEHGIGTADSENAFQITVYSQNYKTPDWIKGGIYYQIFPDRFFNSGKTKESVPFDRYIQNDKSRSPAHLQSNEPCRLNNDYYGGDLSGIEKKLDYLCELSVTCIYLNPIFEAHSNHRYNTADYSKIDPMLGTLEDFKSLCKKAHKKGIKIILDGVFSHTGDDSIYFNKYGRYDSLGAFQSADSSYRSWYTFDNSECGYKSWWGVPSLPETNENDPEFSEYICGENGILRYWQKAGADGWRLDVADELPDSFLDRLRTAVKNENPDALIIGEVWEDATNKISGGGRRRFLQGAQLDTVMNYPFSNGIIDFVTGKNSRELIDLVMDITENYPPQSINCLMNHIGTHDTARILSRLGAGNRLPDSREEQSTFNLNQNELALAKRRLKLASVLQYTLPGVPSLYYGDEAGVQGGKDPFCRKYFPWDNIDGELLNHYKMLGKMRKDNQCFADGEFIPLPSSEFGHIVFLRKSETNTVIVAVNRWCDRVIIGLPDQYTYSVIFGNNPENNSVMLESESFFIAVCHNNR